MQGRKDIQPKMMYQVNIEMLVPADNFYRKLSQTLDLSFLYKFTAQCYGTEGQASIDSVVFFKICLVGMSSANKHVLLSAICYNLKKLMKFNRSKHGIIAKALQNINVKAGRTLFKRAP